MLTEHGQTGMLIMLPQELEARAAGPQAGTNGTTWIIRGSVQLLGMAAARARGIGGTRPIPQPSLHGHEEAESKLN